MTVWDLVSLAQTITNRHILPESAAEAFGLNFLRRQINGAEGKSGCFRVYFPAEARKPLLLLQ